MKIQATIILLSLLLAVAQGGDPTYWAGTWDILMTEPSATACYPDKSITIEQSMTELTFSWVWDKTQTCTNAEIAGTKFTQTVKLPESGTKSLTFQIKVGKAILDGTFRIGEGLESDQAIFKSNNGASAACVRRQDMAYFPGTWDIVTQDNSLCNPDKSITLTQVSATHVHASWTWDNSLECQRALVAGQKFSEDIRLTGRNSAAVLLRMNNVEVLGAFVVTNDQALFGTPSGTSASFVRRQESVNWAGTWNIDSQQAGSGCFPDTSIVITQNSGSITAKWTWANSDFCKGAHLDGKEFTQTVPTPRGRSILLAFFIQAEEELTVISGIFTVNGDQANFASNNKASATFNRKSSGSMGIIIVILLIVAVAAGGYFYVQRNKSKRLQGDLSSSLAGVYGRT